MVQKEEMKLKLIWIKLIQLNPNTEFFLAE